MRLLHRLIVCCTAIVLGSVANAGPQQFALTPQNVRAGVLVLDSDHGPARNDRFGRSAAPFAFYNLDLAAGIKPTGWNIYNPHAPGTVTPDMEARWQSIELGTRSNDRPSRGAPISKRNAEYWLIYLSQVSDRFLSDYDILLLSPHYFAQLNSAEMAKLTKFVDKGGILWIDTAVATNDSSAPNPPIDLANSFPLSFTTASTGNGFPFVNPSSSLLTRPLTITPNDLNLLHTGFLRGVYGMAQNAAFFESDKGQFSRYESVASVGNFPTIAIGRIGDGAIVATTEGASIHLNRSGGVGLGGNYSYTAAAPALEADGVAAAKLAVNIISLLGDYAQQAGGSRKSGSSAIDVTAPVLSKFTDESVPTSLGTSPVTYKGVVVATDKDGYVTVYDADPSSDLDNDGDPDDGIVPPSGQSAPARDISVGQPYDRVWRSKQLRGPLSSPVCVEVPGTNGNLPHDQVLVVDAQGGLNVFDLFSKNANGQLYGGDHDAVVRIIPPGGVFSGLTNGAAPNAPTVSDGFAYMADTPTGGTSLDAAGRVWIANLATGTTLNSTTDWRVGGSDVSGPPLPEFTSSPTVGYIPIQDNSGGFDRVVYAPGTVNGQAGLVSLWLGAKGENPFSWDATGTQLSITTRAASQGNLPVYFPPTGAASSLAGLGPRLTLLKSTGDPLSAGELAGLGISPTAQNGGGGIVNYTITSEAAFKAVVTGVRIDYTIDWGADPVGLSLAIERGRLLFPIPQGAVVGGGSPSQILGNIAMTSQGTLCLTIGTPATSSGSFSGPSNAGSLWWIRENAGRGNFNVVGRWSLFSPTELPTLPTPTAYGNVLVDVDPLLTTIPGLPPQMSAPMGSWSWQGSPTVMGNQVFALATARKGGVIPVTVVLAFAAEPQTPEIHAQNFPIGFSLAQPDIDRSTQLVTGGLTTYDTTSTLTQGAFNYDATTGTISIPNLATVTRGVITDCLNTSMPIIVRTGTSPDTVVQPELNGESWSPLQWYCTYNGVSTQSGPLVTGNTLFFGGKSLVPSILSGSFSLAGNAVVNAMDATVSPSDTFMRTPAGRSWQHQVAQLVPDSSTPGGVTPDPHIRMPSSVGVKTFTDYVTRLLQTVLGSSTTANTVAGGGDTVAVYGDKGLYALSRAEFLVCDQSRVLQVDSNGNAIGSSDGSLNTGAGGGGNAAVFAPMVRPSRAYAINKTEMLIVDSGGNRIVRRDNSGIESRSLDRFFVDPNHIPNGFQANDPVTFNAPRDALTYSNFVYKPAQETVTDQNDVEYWVHYLIADGGNKRLVELIDRYTVDSNGRIGPLVTVTMPDPYAVPTSGPIPVRAVPQAGVLVWQTPATVSGKGFEYSSITRVLLWDADSTKDRYVYVAGVGASQPSRINVGLDNPTNTGIQQSATGNGGVVILDPQSANGIEVYNTFNMPDLTGTPFYNPATTSFDTNTPANTRAQGNRQLGGVNAVSVRSIMDESTGKGALALMISEATGVYEFYVDPTVPNSNGSLGSPSWFINQSAYTALRGAGAALLENAQQFLPAYARRLDSGDVLVVNSYNGLTRGQGIYRGEVLMLQGGLDAAGSNANNGEFAVGKQNLGFNIRSIRFALPPVANGVRNLIAPVFADRR